jgi:hypothetical protein
MKCPHIALKRQDFLKKVIEDKICVIFSTTLFETILVLRTEQFSEIFS